MMVIKCRHGVLDVDTGRMWWRRLGVIIPLRLRQCPEVRPTSTIKVGQETQVAICCSFALDATMRRNRERINMVGSEELIKLNM